MKETTVLVTGGAGYIGSHVTYALLKQGHIVHVVDNFRESRNNVIKHENVSYHEVDLRDKESLEKVFSICKPEVVFHFAALASVPDSMLRPFEYYDTNIVGGLNLLECMRKEGVKKIIFSSSASVYGEPQTEEITEDHPKIPTNTYGYTKLVFENILQDYYRAYDFSSVSLRYFCASGADNEAGLGEYHTPETHVIPSIIETLLGSREEFFVYGNDFATEDGTGIRDYIHVKDLAGAHLKAMDKIVASPASLCIQYNLGINKGFSVMELIHSAEKIAGEDLKYSTKERRPGDPSRLIADSRKAQVDLGWVPKITTVHEIINDAYVFFKKKKG